MDERLRRFVQRHRASEIDRSYDVPLDSEDEWGNLADFLEAAGSA